jgi:hypothetical protein
VIEAALKEMTNAATNLGAAKNRIDLQKTFTTSLMDSIERGVGQLVDADMNKESTRLQALQVQQQLGIQALSIANGNSQSILSLFRYARRPKRGRRFRGKPALRGPAVSGKNCETGGFAEAGRARSAARFRFSRLLPLLASVELFFERSGVRRKSSRPTAYRPTTSGHKICNLLNPLLTMSM